MTSCLENYNPRSPSAAPVVLVVCKDEELPLVVSRLLFYSCSSFPCLSISFLLSLTVSYSLVLETSSCKFPSLSSALSPCSSTSSIVITFISNYLIGIFFPHAGLGMLVCVILVYVKLHVNKTNAMRWGMTWMQKCRQLICVNHNRYSGTANSFGRL